MYAAWFAVLLLRLSLDLDWWHLAYLVAFWVITAYLALPRLHRVLTQIYVPEYFIGRVRTADGLLGDPVNLAVRGSAEQIDAVMRQAGWVVADPITVRTSWRIITGSVTGRSYPQAPVSSLFLFGRQQDVAFQQEVADSPAKRHHVRLWRCPQGWFLPGGHQVDWVAAGTYDRAVGLSLFTLQVTHKIDADTDAERDYIVDTVRATDLPVSVDVIEDFSTGYHHRNGGGDAIHTDGDLPVLDVTSVVVPDPPPDLEPDVAAASWVTRSSEDDQANNAVPPRPAVFLVAVGAIALGALLQVLGVLVGALQVDLGDGTLASRFALASVTALVQAVVQVPMLVLILRGHAWARYVVLAGLTLDGAIAMVAPSLELGALGPLQLLLTSTSIVALLALSDRSASRWLAALRADRRARRARRRSAAGAPA
ncbi:LssY C-terminal domain-containing protein [Serinicoccus chungangensis]|uniref:LssY C-terminal domain-containing protein n=1 Tax=Serinicoccus chungangensis TaxID=767452 RepID=UPI001118E941|nr:LssY C-terminal domain-containing protein [Serinicoccus chungangensis]